MKVVSAKNLLQSKKKSPLNSRFISVKPAIALTQTLIEFFITPNSDFYLTLAHTFKFFESPQ